MDSIVPVVVLVVLLTAYYFYQKYSSKGLVPRVHERARALAGGPLSHVLNFRDLGGLPVASGKKKVKTGVIFRCGAPTNASEEDVEYLLERLKISTLIDFRNLEEIKLHPEVEKGFEDYFESCDVDVFQKQSKKARKLFRVPLNSIDYLSKVQGEAPFSVRAKCNVAGLLGKKVQVLFVLRYLAAKGLAHMYITTAEYMKPEFCQVMKAILYGDSPIMMFCQLGKDRTGMSSALFLSVLGVSKELIADDYAKSEGQVSARDLHVLRRYLNEDFAKAPKKNMEVFLAHLEEHYGSVSKYLESAGFSMADQQKMREKYLIDS